LLPTQSHPSKYNSKDKNKEMINARKGQNIFSNSIGSKVPPLFFYVLALSAL